MFLFEHIRFLDMLQNLISEYSMFLIATKYNIDFHIPKCRKLEIGTWTSLYLNTEDLCMSQNHKILNLAKFAGIAYFFI